MNKKLFISLILSFISIGVFACFMDQPKTLETISRFLEFDYNSNTASLTLFVPRNKVQDITKYNSNITNSHIVNWVNQNYSNKLSYYTTITESEDCVMLSYPITINCEFHGFKDNDDKIIENITIKRMCLLYFGKDNKWKIIKDIHNPSGEIISETSQGKSMFGKYILTKDTGFNSNEILFITFYFEGVDKNGNTYKTHQNINNLINTAPHLLNYETNEQTKIRVIKIGIRDNVKPL